MAANSTLPKVGTVCAKRWNSTVPKVGNNKYNQPISNKITKEISFFFSFFKSKSYSLDIFIFAITLPIILKSSQSASIWGNIGLSDFKKIAFDLGSINNRFT